MIWSELPTQELDLPGGEDAAALIQSPVDACNQNKRGVDQPGLPPRQRPADDDEDEG